MTSRSPVAAPCRVSQLLLNRSFISSSQKESKYHSSSYKIKTFSFFCKVKLAWEINKVHCKKKIQDVGAFMFDSSSTVRNENASENFV